ncbi:MAG: hypothetical protein Q8916_09870 [Bacteroidota bacterium]|nr:hypothetical protein [Bacteroidota bacterium]
MKRFIGATISFLFLGISTECSAQTDTSFHSAIFSSGVYGTEAYEEFDFDIRNGHRDVIEYSYGKKPRTLALDYKGLDTLDGHPSFNVQFKNGLVLTITPEKGHLHVSDKKGTYSKIFVWHYEGPINGIGTYCTPCADAEESMVILEKYFLLPE